MMGSEGYNDSNSNIYMVHKKLEERIGGILCCTVCLDLPKTAIYQVLREKRAVILLLASDLNEYIDISVQTVI